MNLQRGPKTCRLWIACSSVRFGSRPGRHSRSIVRKSTPAIAPALIWANWAQGNLSTGNSGSGPPREVLGGKTLLQYAKQMAPTPQAGTAQTGIAGRCFRLRPTPELGRPPISI